MLAAIRADKPVLPVVCIDLGLARPQFGMPRLGAHRAKFWMECVDGLRVRLRSLGSDLLVLRGAAVDVLPKLIAEQGVAQVYFHRAAAIDERREEAALSSQCPDVSWVGHWGQLLVTPDEAPFAIQDTPATFTAFRKKVESRVEISRAEEGPSTIPAFPKIDPGSIPSVEDFSLEVPRESSQAVMTYRGGAEAAKERVRSYIWANDRLRIYKETRNGMLEADDSSKFSPWLAHGAVSPRQILDEIRRYEDERVANDSTYWLFFELLWRDYFYYIAHKYGARLFQVDGLRGLRLPWRRDPKLIEAWCAGQTGYPLIDACMRELSATGYTSNRARQNAASFFTKVLNQDWRIGAAWFEGQLIDYDPASNWGNWAYNAGVGNDARGFRYFHIPKQTRDYDPDGAFIKHWVPELRDVPAEWLPEPYRAPGAIQQQVHETYPRPVVDLEASVDAARRAYDRADPPPPGRRGSGRPRRPSRRR